MSSVLGKKVGRGIRRAAGLDESPMSDPVIRRAAEILGVKMSVRVTADGRTNRWLVRREAGAKHFARRLVQLARACLASPRLTHDEPVDRALEALTCARDVLDPHMDRRSGVQSAGARIATAIQHLLRGEGQIDMEWLLPHLTTIAGELGSGRGGGGGVRGGDLGALWTVSVSVPLTAVYFSEDGSPPPPEVCDELMEQASDEVWGYLAGCTPQVVEGAPADWPDDALVECEDADRLLTLGEARELCGG